MSRRLLFGTWPPGVGSGFGLRCALPGRDAASPDDRDLTFSSDWPEVLPVLQAGVFTIGGGQSFAVGTPDPGFLPFGRFLINGSDSFGQSTLPPVPLHQWNNYATIAFRSENGRSALALSVGRGHVSANYTLYAPGGQPQGWPSSWQVAYVVYAVPIG